MSATKKLLEAKPQKSSDSVQRVEKLEGLNVELNANIKTLFDQTSEISAALEERVKEAADLGILDARTAKIVKGKVEYFAGASDTLQRSMRSLANMIDDEITKGATK